MESPNASQPNFVTCSKVVGLENACPEFGGFPSLKCGAQKKPILGGLRRHWDLSAITFAKKCAINKRERYQLQRVPYINLVKYGPQAANTNSCMHGEWRAGAAIWLQLTLYVLLRMCYSHWSLLSLSVWYRSFVWENF